MKLIELLLEYDLNKVQQLDGLFANRSKDPSRPPASSTKDLADVIEQQMNIRSGEIVYWILSRYLKLLPNPHRDRNACHKYDHTEDHHIADHQESLD